MQQRTCATATRSALASGAPVSSKVPSRVVTLGSEMDCEKRARIPAEGSTAVRVSIEELQAGCARSARVNMPVPDPILAYR